MNRTGRYAPSPSGSLHLGNLRTALIAWLLARSQGAGYLLRIEDLDQARSRPEHVSSQLADLRALGLDWDAEMPRQSSRTVAYEAAIERLRTAGLIYECFCTRTEVREAASAPHGELPDGAYPGTCRNLSATERRARAQERPAALRVNAGAVRIEFEDRVAGIQVGVVDDFVVRRNDGVHGYNLAVVLDDGEQGVGEVVRGDDLLDSTPRQIWIAEQLGLDPISSWVHVPLVHGPDGERLAKRHGSITLADRAAAGESPADVLALLARSLDLCEDAERPTLEQLLERFDPAVIASADPTLPL